MKFISTSLYTQRVISKKVLSDAETKVLINYAPIQNKINTTGLKRDFENFSRQMILKWLFCKDPTPSFGEKPAFTTKSS